MPLDESCIDEESRVALAFSDGSDLVWTDGVGRFHFQWEWAAHGSRHGRSESVALSTLTACRRFYATSDSIVEQRAVALPY